MQDSEDKRQGGTDPDEQGEHNPLFSHLGEYLRATFETWKRERYQYELEWLKDLRQYRGQYDPDTLKKMSPKRSKAFIRLTRTKVKTMDSRVAELLFPSGGERNWGIEPTPVPEIDPMKKARVATQLRNAMFQARMNPNPQQQQMAAMLEQEPPTDEELEMVVKDIAKHASKEMEKEIDDQLVEGRYEPKCRNVIHSGHVYGTGVLKGPMVDTRIEKHWNDMGNGQFELVEKNKTFPYYDWVSIWDTYPDMSAIELDDCEGIFQRHVMPKHKLRKLARKPSFKGDLILKYLHDYTEGDAQLQNFEVELKSINGNKDSVLDRRRKYEVLEYWGVVDASMLAECGCKVPEDLMTAELEVNVWLLGNTVVKAVINPTEQKQRPYHFYYFEKDETSIFGISVPNVLRDPQILFNAAVRAGLDNAAHSAGPVIEVNADLLVDDAEPDAIYPFRVYVRRGTGQDAQAAAIRVYQIPNYVGQLMQLADKFKEWGDEASTIPSYMHGENDQGVGRTVGGLSMLMGAANITLKDTIKHYDNGITKPFITAMYHWNMQFNPRRDIKGDYQVKAKGSSTLVAKEIHAQQLDQFAASVNNAFDAPYINREDLLKARAKAHDLGADIIKSEEDVRKALDAAGQPGAPGAAPGGPGPMAGGVMPAGAPAAAAPPAAPAAPQPAMGGA